MDNYIEKLDQVFHSLANPTRRDIVAKLSSGPKSVSSLAELSTMALPSFMKHIDVLEESGILSSSKSGRVRTLTLDTEPLLFAEHWLDARKAEWQQRLDQLDGILLELNQKKEKDL